MFGVVEPKGWTGHTKDAARYRLNVYFCLGKKNIDNSPAIMHITVFGKGNSTIQQHLDYDIEQYKKHFWNLELKDFSVEGLKYSYVSRIFKIGDKIIDYVCFLDPGVSSPLYVVFVLHGPKEISPQYEKDFISLVKSFTWMGN